MRPERRGDVSPDEFDKSGDDRKLRSAIESIARDQENLRMSTPLISGRTVFAACAAMTLAVVASSTAAFPMWYAVLMPAATSGLFVQTSVSETSGTRSKGLARHNSGQAVSLALQQETILSTAEDRKSILPFGVGLTAIFAAACVSLKFFNEKLAEIIPEDSINPPLIAVDNLILLFFAAATVAGALYTTEGFINMRAALVDRDEDKRKSKESSDWEILRLPSQAREPDANERNLGIALTLMACFLPLGFAYSNFDFGSLKLGFNYNKEFQEFINGICVFVSACAGAQAAVVFLVAEQQFSDAERRVAAQCKQAALSELFYAQSQVEAAPMPVRSAWTGGLLAATAFFVEFSGSIAALLPWPAVISSMRSVFSSDLTKSSADATWLERRIGRGRRPGRQDALSSTTRELTRLSTEIFRTEDSFTEAVKTSLLELPQGAKREFTNINSESRRQVHFIAAELGMVSQSVVGKRMVVVTNFGGVKMDAGNAGKELVLYVAGSLDKLRIQTINLLLRGVPEKEQDILWPTATAAAIGAAIPFGANDAITDLLTPLICGGVGLVTVWQERVGKSQVAIAKNKTANVRLRVAKADSLFGRATLALSALPTYLAVATCATTASIIFFEGNVLPGMRWLTLPLLVITAWSCALSAQRLKSIQFYIKQAAQTVKGQVPPPSAITSRRWWMIPLAVAVIVPVDLPRRLTVACAVLATQIGFMMSASFLQLASSEFYAARAQRVWARSDAWAQEASTESRALPLNSAVAIVNTLLSTTLIVFDTPLGSAFPIIGLAVCFQALQSRAEATANAEQTLLETKQIQQIGTESPPFLDLARLEGADRTQITPSQGAVRYSSDRNNMLEELLPEIQQKLASEGRTVDQLFEALALGRDELIWTNFREFFRRMKPDMTEAQLERLWLVFDKDLNGDVSRQEFQSVLDSSKKGWFSRLLKGDLYLLPVAIPRFFVFGFRRLLKLWDEIKAEDHYRLSPAQRAVDAVASNVTELRVSVRSSERDWLRTGSVVGVVTSAAILAPFVLSEVITEILLPLVGAALTVFAVTAEADARRSIAASKVWAAELNEIASTQEELLAVGGLYKARLISITALSVAVGITCIVIEHPWHFLAVFPQLSFLQTGLQWGLVLFQTGISTWAMMRLLVVMKWCQRVRTKMTASTMNFGRASDETPMSFFKGTRVGAETAPRLLMLLSALPSILLAIFPLGRHFGKRAVASTAGGALVVGIALFVAEVVTSKAEIAQAQRMRSFALADAFCNTAEQQGAVLPLVSAATIAAAALITFATELNPVYASGLTVLQAMAWIVASRKAVAAKFESEAALKVNLVSMNPQLDAASLGAGPLQKLKRFILQ